MAYSEEALRNSFAAVRKEIEGIKARNSLIDERLKNSFANIKKDMDFLKESIAKREDFISLEHLNEKLSKINSAIEDIKTREIAEISSEISELKDDFSRDVKKIEKGVYKDFEHDLKRIRSELKALDKARIKNGKGFEKIIDSIKDELDIDSKLRKIEKRVSEPVVKEVIKEKPFVKRVTKEKSVFDEEKPKKRKKREEKGMFSKMIDFFAEE